MLSEGFKGNIGKKSVKVINTEIKKCKLLSGNSWIVLGMINPFVPNAPFLYPLKRAGVF